ncbi:MAG: HypC/HybG/HupF family hydrogenase formation chaperone [Ideonella sp.]|nr:HypC/HybG/HupF family hydrogenase formation chaperone [Ideonella sp.]MBL0148170.1 HypC/HybG/HupF family hydrogenase formation chaperone [Ideonella sp.]
MCIGLPMQVIAAREGFATVRGRGEQREVQTTLVAELKPGDWVLVFIDSAREVIDAERATEVNATLDLIAAAMRGETSAHDHAAFALPSAMSAEQLAALSGATALSKEAA